MKNAVMIDANDIKKILAEMYHVPETSVIKAQYSYIVITEGEYENEICRAAEDG